MIPLFMPSGILADTPNRSYNIFVQMGVRFLGCGGRLHVGARMIHEILTNSIYIRDLVQSRRRVKSCKVHQIEAVPEEEWVRVPRTSSKGREVHLFSGFLKCADCGKSITRRVRPI